MNIKANTKNIVFIVEGGLGKCIASTAVIKSLKAAYPDKNIIVMAGYPDVFMYNPNVRRVFNFNNPLYFYEDYVNEETQFIRVEPYLEREYLSKRNHLIESWCKVIGIPCITKYPDMHFLPNELESAELYVKQLTNQNQKKLVLLQWVGGKVPKDNSEQLFRAAQATMYRRSLPKKTARKVADYLINNDYTVGLVQHPNFPDINGTHKMWLPPRNLLAVGKFATSFIGIDSFLQHAMSCPEINCKGVVAWGGTSPECLGYDKNVNLTKEVCDTPYCHRPNTYLFDVQPHGVFWDCKHGDACMKAFTAEEIIKAFESIVKKPKKKRKKSAKKN